MNDATQFFNTSGGGGYQISRSLRFNSADSAYLSRTPASAGNRKTWTWAGWVKRSGLGANNGIFEVSGSPRSDANSFSLYFADGAYGTVNDALVIARNSFYHLITTQVFRDVSAWYHIVLAADTTQATASNRLKLYVNGSQITTFNSTTYPSLNEDLPINNSVSHSIARHAAIAYLNGYLADVHFIDGQALTPSSFGEFDTNNIWQPKAYSGGTYGTNGFKLDFADNSTAAALGYDAAGSNDWTVNNLSVYSTSYNTIYSPPTGFSVWADPFATGVSNVTYSNSNKTATADITTEKTVITTGAKSSGKWYIEFTRTGIGDPADEVWGLAANNSSYPGATGTDGVGTTYTRPVFNSLGSGTSVTPSVPNFTNGAVCQIAVDFDAKKVWWGVDNVWSSSGNPSTGSNPTFSAWTGSPVWYAAQRLYSSGNSSTINGGPAAVLIGNDSLVDSPTNYGTDTGAGSEVRGNYCTWNPLLKAGGDQTYTNGNLDVNTGSISAGRVVGTLGVSSGKWYWEVVKTAGSGGQLVGIVAASENLLTEPGSTANGYSYYSSGQKYTNATLSSYGASWTTNDVIGIALDLGAGTLVFYKNGVSQGTAFTGISGTFVPAVSDDNSGSSNSTTAVANFGQRPFAYTAPSGFKALCTTNLPEPTIADGSTAMDVALYTGNGSTQTISGLGFSPDLVWIKNRNVSGYWHELVDSVRGVSRRLFSNDTSAEDFRSGQGLTAFNSDGFTLTYVDGNDNGNNSNGNTFVAWTWDAGSSTVTNTQGSITSQVRANASAGFSIVSWVGNATTGATVGHGLGVKPHLVIYKNRDNGSQGWTTLSDVLLGATGYLQLNTTAAKGTASLLAAPTSTVLTLAAYTDINGNGNNMIAYCFAPVAGYSAFGSYVGNGSATGGPFVYLGFRPKWVLIKNSDNGGSSSDWWLFDSNRGSVNINGTVLYPNLSNAEVSLTNIFNMDFLSNGFRLSSATNPVNQSGQTHIYAAFAESPFALARAR